MVMPIGFHAINVTQWHKHDDPLPTIAQKFDLTALDSNQPDPFNVVFRLH